MAQEGKLTASRQMWIDAARALGIWLIYLGHITNTVPFIWRFHVPLFFFLSGCTEALSTETNFFRYFIKKCKGLLVPWIVFNLVSLVVHIFSTGCGLNEVLVYGYQFLKGTTRNTGVAGALWFFTCLFVIQVLFFAVKQMKNPAAIFLTAFAICYTTGFFADYNQPFLPYNVDSALHFIVYYAAGYVAMPMLERLMCGTGRPAKSLLLISGLLAWLYTGSCYLGLDLFGNVYAVPHVGRVMSIGSALIMIYAVLVLGRALQNVKFLTAVGRKTLYLCGSEYLVYKLLGSVYALLGINITIGAPLQGMIYAAMVLSVSYFVLVPLMERLVTAVWKFPRFWTEDRQYIGESSH